MHKFTLTQMFEQYLDNGQIDSHTLWLQLNNVANNHPVYVGAAIKLASIVIAGGVTPCSLAVLDKSLQPKVLGVLIKWLNVFYHIYHRPYASCLFLRLTMQTSSLGEPPCLTAKI